MLRYLKSKAYYVFVLIVAKCIVNQEMRKQEKRSMFVLIVAKCIVNSGAMKGVMDGAEY